MRELAGELRWLSLNWATVREQWDLRQSIEGCARHGIPGIAPWREPLRELGLGAAARLIRDHGLIVTGLCRAGMFPAADGASRQAAIDDNRRAIDEAAAIGAQCLIVLAGGMPTGSKDLALARRQARDGIAAVLPTPAPPACRSRSSPCTRCTRPIAAVSARSSKRTTCAPSSIRTARAALASRSTCTTCSGIRSWSIRSPVSAPPVASWLFTSATG